MEESLFQFSELIEKKPIPDKMTNNPQGGLKISFRSKLYPFDNFQKFLQRSEKDVTEFFEEIFRYIHLAGYEHHHMDCFYDQPVFVVSFLIPEKRGPPYEHQCISCPAPDNPVLTAKQKEAHLGQTTYHNYWIDVKNRPAIIVTPIRHVERLLDLQPAEILEFFSCYKTIIATHFGPLDDAKETSVKNNVTWKVMKLNHGNCRNEKHLHLKIFFDGENWSQLRRETKCQIQ